MPSKTRREQILTSALEVFAARGYHGASIADIIEAAGIARGTFYLYFENKRAVFDAILDVIFEELHARMAAVALPEERDDGVVIQQVQDNARRLAAYMLGSPAVVRVLMAEAVGLDEKAVAKLRTFYGRLGAWVAESLEDGMAFGVVRPCEPLVTAHAIIGTLRGVFWAWAVGLLELDEDTLVEQIMGLLLGGILIPNK